MPSIGLVLGHPPTNSLEAQHVKRVDMFPHHKLCIQLLKEVQWYFPIVVWGNVKHHVQSIHPMVSNGWKGAPLNGILWPGALWNVIHPMHSKQCIDVFFCYFQLLYLVVDQPISVFLSFPLPAGCDAIQNIVQSCDHINNSQ